MFVEDSEECCLVVSRALANADIDLVTSSTISGAVEFVRNGLRPDLIILDLGLPDGDGFTALEKMRNSGIETTTPVFFLTSVSELESKVTAFNLGADDYIVKPVSPVELRARVAARLRKNDKKAVAEFLRQGDLSIDLAKVKVYLAENGLPRQVELTSKEFKILSWLMQNQDRVFSRKELVSSIWGSTVHLSVRTIDSHICSLRKKLKSAGRYIKNVPGSGYKFSAVEPAAELSAEISAV